MEILTLEEIAATMDKMVEMVYIHGLRDGSNKPIKPIEEPMATNVSDKPIEAATEQPKAIGKGYKSPKIKWDDSMVNVLIGYAELGFDINIVFEEMSDSYGLTKQSIRRKLSREGYRVRRKDHKIVCN